MLAELPNVQVVGAAGNGAEGLALARTLRPDVVVLDGSGEPAVGAVELEQVRKRGTVGQVVQHLHLGVNAALVHDAEDLAADAAESVDTDAHCKPP